MAGFVRWSPKPLLQDVDSKIAAKMTQMGNIGVAEARRLVPVDTGQLRDSIGFIWRQSDKTLQLYADKHYAIFIEMGTSRSPARPFLRPALGAMAKVWGGGAVNLELSMHATPKKYQLGYRKQHGGNITVRNGLFGTRHARVKYGKNHRE